MTEAHVVDEGTRRITGAATERLDKTPGELKQVRRSRTTGRQVTEKSTSYKAGPSTH